MLMTIVYQHLKEAEDLDGALFEQWPRNVGTRVKTIESEACYEYIGMSKQELQTAFTHLRNVATGSLSRSSKRLPSSFPVIVKSVFVIAERTALQERLTT